jgi:serine/threonine protein kinase
VTEHILFTDGNPKTLHEFVSKDFEKGLPEAAAQLIFAQLMHAVACAHDHKILHQDINTSNILLQQQILPDGSAPRWIAKLCDFGSSKDCAATFPRTFRSTAPNFTAPEVLQSLDDARRGQQLRIVNTGAIDVWSCGVVLLTMLVGAAPFQEVTKTLTKQLMRSLAQGPGLVQSLVSVADELRSDSKISEACHALLLRIFTPDPELRPDARVLISDPWVQAARYEPKARARGAQAAAECARRRVRGQLCQDTKCAVC